MLLDRNKLYSILLIACVAGYIWLYYSITSNVTENKSVEVCLIKHTTNIPCPSCGSTRSIISLTKGNFVEAFDLNPIGYIVALIMLIAPVWIIVDIILRNNSLFVCYQKIESHLKKTKYAIPLILLVIINWIWNITKGV
ncbi:uncharacterized protein DUF2752 [Flavobacterium glaciei]|uniref:Uncharacterized protein DUF2752 n=1 Tax=Flavobacterium glaciei TaxID=386300 RepID=A0A562PFY0_9FLAO|nr:uncharacterized protein DUF2752 [Flavobacterium glaciei]TWI43344.1 uncharacterized protein DUF2752 [Flavobacterium glaciei]